MVEKTQNEFYQGEDNINGLEKIEIMFYNYRYGNARRNTLVIGLIDG